MAWRVILKPAASWVMDLGPSSPRRETSFRRVSSPRAAKRGAELLTLELGRMDKILLEHPHHDAPALLVGGEGLGPARDGDPVEPGLRHGQGDPARGLLQREHDEGRGLRAVV